MFVRYGTDNDDDEPIPPHIPHLSSARSPWTMSMSRAFFYAHTFHSLAMDDDDPVFWGLTLQYIQ